MLREFGEAGSCKKSLAFLDSVEGGDSLVQKGDEFLGHLEHFGVEWT